MKARTLAINYTHCYGAFNSKNINKEEYSKKICWCKKPNTGFLQHTECRKCGKLIMPRPPKKCTITYCIRIVAEQTGKKFE